MFKQMKIKINKNFQLSYKDSPVFDVMSKIMLSHRKENLKRQGLIENFNACVCYFLSIFLFFTK